MTGRLRTETVIQYENAECGAAALCIVLRFHHCYISLEELRVACGVTRDGSNALNIIKAARSHGMEAFGVRRDSLEKLQALPQPTILHWNRNHFVVFEGADTNRVYINDPKVGPTTITHEEFKRAFTGMALVFQPGTGFQTRGKPFNVTQSLRERLHGAERRLLEIIGISLLLFIPGFVLPLLLRFFVDEILGKRIDLIGMLLAGMACVLLARVVLTILQQRFLLRLEMALAYNGAVAFFDHLLRLPLSFFAQRLSGDLVSRVQLNHQVAQLLSGEIATAVLGILLMLFYAILMFQYDILLTVISIGFAVLNFGVLQVISARRRALNARLLQETARRDGTSVNGLAAIESIKAAGMESSFFARWAGLHAKVVNAEQALGFLSHLAGAAPYLIGLTNAAITLTLGADRIIAGNLSAGALVAFQSLAASFMQPISQLTQLGGQVQEVEGSLNRLDDVLQAPTVAKNRQLSEVQIPVLLSGELTLSRVTFGYNPNTSPLIKEISFSIAPGKQIALVGESGSGKSTIAKLVAGLYREWSGGILFDGIPRARLSESVFAASIAMINQEIALFSGTILDNLTLWDDTIPMERVIAAAKDACIHDVIMQRPDGYHNLVDAAAANFSGGERQRLELARALVHNPKLLILDEATSALDEATETLVLANIRARGCACLVIAHRLSAIQRCDEVISLERGEIVWRGTPEQYLETQTTTAPMLDRDAAPIDVALETGKIDSPQPTAYRDKSLPAKLLSVRDFVFAGMNAIRRELVTLFLLIAILALFNILLPLGTGLVFDQIIPARNRSRLLILGGGLLVGAGLSTLLNFMGGLTALRIEGRIDNTLRSMLWDRLLRLPVPFFRRYGVADLAQRTAGIKQIRSAFADVSAFLMIAILVAIVNMVIMTLIDSTLTTLLVGMTIIYLFMLIMLGQRQRVFQKQTLQAEGEQRNFALQILNGISKLRVAGAEQRALKLWIERFREQQQFAAGARIVQGNAAAIRGSYPILALMFLLYIAATQQRLSIGQFLMFNAAFLQLVGAAAQFGEAFLRGQLTLPALERLNPILQTLPEVTGQHIMPKPLQGQIELKNVSFRYGDSWLFHNLSLSIAPGETVALIGASGSGKSTLLRLLLGFEQPEQGEIYYDGQPLSTLNIEGLRKQLGVVLQNGMLTVGDILTNITGSRMLTIDAAWNAAHLAAIDDDIQQMPMGMNTILNEAQYTLSGGQIQRLLIARALAAKPPVIFFDEATSALDERHQAKIIENLRRMKITQVIVAHRLSAVQHADRIYTLENGILQLHPAIKR